MRSILVVSDPAPASGAALRTGARIAAAAGGTLHVFPGESLLGLSLREAVPLLGPAAAMVPPVPGGRGAPPERGGVVARARRLGAELIVLPAGMAGVADTAEAALAEGIPVLVAGEGAGHPFDRVLVPLGSDDMDAATLRRACEWLRPLELRGSGPLAEVHVLHVCRTLGDWRRIGARFEAEVRAAEEAVRRMAGVFHRHVRWAGVRWPEIVLAAREIGAGLVVLRPRPTPDGGAERTWRAVVGQARRGVLLLPPAAAPPEGAPAREAEHAPELVPA